jgi:uncharacterized protein
MRFFTVESLGPSQGMTREGFLIAENVPLARTGSQLYHEKEIPIKGDSSGRVIISRDEDEVFKPSMIASLQGKPVVIDHPDQDVSPENYHDYAVGTVINPRRGVGLMDNLLLGDLIIYDQKAIKLIRDKELREVSVGYDSDYIEDGPGRGHQANILANHLALVREGRCGPVCRIGDGVYPGWRTRDSAYQRRKRTLHIHCHL